ESPYRPASQSLPVCCTQQHNYAQNKCKYAHLRPNGIKSVEKGQEPHPTKTDFEKGVAHAILTLQTNPIWGISDPSNLRASGKSC
ncbi:MAG: hypothetical protein V3S78_00405, partial [Hyphomicrobium sp.]